MTISDFFTDLRAAYQSELDDLTFDSEGRDVLSQRLADKRQTMGFLVKMMEISPEMVAVVFHQGFAFKHAAVMDDLLSHEADELPDWHNLASNIELAPWAQDLAHVVLQAPGGEWFLTVAAALEFMASKPGAALAADVGNDADPDDNEDDEFDVDANDRADAKARKEAGDDWMVNQGFDRKE